MVRSDPSTDLAQFLLTLPPARGVTVADPDQPEAVIAEAVLVLGVGVAAGSAGELIAAAARAGAAALLLRGPVPAVLLDRADRLDLALRVLPATVSWPELHRRLLVELGPTVLQPDDELAELAQTISILTGGPVTIEDSTSAQVLAYSRSRDEVDELRRLSILGRSGPPEYLALLREWGVYDRLAESEEVLEIAEHAASGVRRRLAVGVFAGSRQLGTIWVQQGQAGFGPQAKQALLGAARLTALHLLGSATRTGPGRRPQPGRALSAILAGRAEAATLGFGAVAGRPCAVAAVAATPADRDAAAAALHLDEIAAIVTVHVAAFRRHALVDAFDGRVYALLPSLEAAGPAVAMLTDAVSAVRRHADPGARAALGVLAGSFAEAGGSRRSADLALGVRGGPLALAFDSVRASLVVQSLQNHLIQQMQSTPELADPRIQSLVEQDRTSAATLLGFLEAGSDVGRVAAALGVHQTTVRYRLRRTVERLELDLTDPDARLAAHHQLRCNLRLRPDAG